MNDAIKLYVSLVRARARARACVCACAGLHASVRVSSCVLRVQKTFLILQDLIGGLV